MTVCIFRFCPVFFALTQASYLHKTVSGVRVEVEGCVFLYSCGEGGVGCNHSSFYVSSWKQTQ